MNKAKLHVSKSILGLKPRNLYHIFIYPAINDGTINIDF